MEKNRFLLDKKKQLSKKDSSNIGSWDKKIAGLCNKINKKKNYYTTSSCSGRIVLLKYSDKKIADAFLFRNHGKVSFDLLKKELNRISKEYSGLVEFQMTSCIMHVACREISDAFLIVNKSRECGWKRSGVMGNKRNICELHSTENMSFPVMDEGEMMVDDEYLKLVLGIANSKLVRVWKKIDRLKGII
ncbi:hypothetical protein GOV12_01345 [Candidatus Pacearchaeota archaeon]|nr:hypothetical protein [Candidatus Pacearchaeota archaeon]